MKRTDLVKQTIRKMNQLPDDKLYEVADFTEFLLNRIEENDLQNGIQKIASKSKSYNFLKFRTHWYVCFCIGFSWRNIQKLARYIF